MKTRNKGGLRPLSKLFSFISTVFLLDFSFILLNDRLCPGLFLFLLFLSHGLLFIHSLGPTASRSDQRMEKKVRKEEK